MVLVFLSLAASGAQAAPKLGYQLELGQSLAIPIGDGDAKRQIDPAYAASLRFALLIGLPHQLHVGPFVELAGVAVNTDDAAFEDAGLDARYGRVRVLLGPHVAYRLLDRIDLWFRIGVGLDHTAGSVYLKLGNIRVTDASSTTFAVAPSLGVTAAVWRMLTVGGSVGFPVAVSHAFAGGNGFIVADLELTLLVGARL